MTTISFQRSHPGASRALRVASAFLCLGVVTCGGDNGGPTGGINISASAVSFSAVPGGSVDPKTVSITPSTGELTGLEASVAFVSPPPSSWLSATFEDPAATAENPATLRLEVTETDLPPATYQATVTVRSPDAANSPTIDVSFTVEAATALAVATQPPAAVASGATFQLDPVVQLQSASGAPVPQGGVEISVVVEGGGTLAGPASATTDDQGMATFSGLSITALAGEQILLFTAPGLTEVRSDPIVITIGEATQIAPSSVTSQLAEAGTLVNEPPAALVTDAGGNPVAGIAVTFAVTGGGGVSNPTAPIPTNDAGIAALTSWQLGSLAGANTVTATAAGLVGSPVEFSATGTNGGVVPGPVSAAKSSVSASPASFAAGSIGTTITVTARDADNNLIGGAEVSLSSTGSNFTFGSTSLTTGTNGATLGKASTTYTSTTAETKSISAQITVGGLTVTPSPAGVTVAPGAPSATLSTVIPSPATVIGLANTSTITITVKDANGNLIGGRAVSLVFVGASDGGSVSAPSSTDLSGVTTGTLASSTGGVYEVRATVGGGTPVTINQTASVTFLLTFTGDIEPLFTVGHPNADPSGGTTSACSSCHLPYVVGGTVPDLSFAHLTDFHDGKPVVDPGNADGSLLIQALEHDPSISLSEQMPGATQRLPVEVIAKIRRWIDQEDALRE